MPIGMMGGQQQGGMQGPDMSMVSQILAQMRGNQRPQQQQSGLMGMMPLLMQLMGNQGGGSGFNNSPLSLFNPMASGYGRYMGGQ